MKKFIFILMILALIAVIVYFSMNSNNSGFFGLESQNFKIEETNFDIINAEMQIEYDVNGIILDNNQKELKFNIFFDKISEGNLPELDNSNFFVYFIDNEEPVYANTRIISSQDYKSKNAFSLVMDHSGSMFAGYSPEPADYVLNSVEYFINQKQQNDYLNLIKFDDKVHTLNKFDNDNGKLLEYLKNDPTHHNGTALIDGIYKGLINVKTLNDYNKAVIAFADGAENSSYKSFQNLLNLAQQINTPVFTIALYSPTFNPENLVEISKNTGGFSYIVNDLKELQDIYSEIYNIVNNSYVINARWDKKSPKSNQDIYLRLVKNNKIIANFILNNN